MFKKFCPSCDAYFLTKDEDQIYCDSCLTHLREGRIIEAEATLYLTEEAKDKL